MELEHNPRTKQEIKNLLYDLLYEPVLRAFRERLKTIIGKNVRLQKGTHMSMIYRGEIYIAEDSITPPPRAITQLHPSLRPEMDEYLKESAYLNTHELPYVLGFINQVLNSSSNLPDYLALLPESVHGPLITLLTTCPCRNSSLDPKEIEALRERNTVSIELMKQRLTLNLLL